METITMTKTKEGVELSRPLRYVVDKLRTGVYEITIKRKSRQRTTPQNSLLWMWLSCIEDETGTPKKDLYDAYCARFLSRLVEMPSGEQYLTHTTSSNLNTKEFTDFLDRIQADAAEYGIRLPNPSDEYFQEFLNEYQNRI